MDAIARYLVCNALMGSAFGMMFGLTLLATDTFGLQSLIAASPDATAVTTIFLVGGAMIFTPLAICTAVGLLADADFRTRRGKH